MKILGIGVDIIDNKRIKIAIKNKKFIKRIFSKEEILLSKKKKNKILYFSKRFAAKEALAKAFGMGFRDNLNYKDIKIVNNKLGKPNFIITNKLRNIVKKKFRISNFNFFLSISDEKNYSVAFVTLQKKWI